MSLNNTQKLICIFGLGQSGVSVASYLQRTGQEFFVVDSRTNPPGKDQLSELTNCQSKHYGSIPVELLNNASMIVLSPGISPQKAEIVAAQNHGVEIVGDIELFVRNTQKRIVAITGSNGKSTVTDLTHQLLKASGLNAKVGGNFGIPALDYLPKDDADIYVLELSSFQLDTTQSLNADVAVLLNVSEDHMDRYSSFEEYRNSKLTIFNHAKKILANADDNLTQPVGINHEQLFSINKNDVKYSLDNNNSKFHLKINAENVIDIDELIMSGRHNWSNALVSLAILNELELDISATVLNELKQYQGLSHRFQLVEKTQNIEWINDSKATNVGATLAALNSIDKNYYPSLVLIAGGDAKGGDLSPLKKPILEKVSHLILIGKDAQLFASFLPKEKIFFARDMREAVVKAKNYLVKNQSSQKRAMVLLSPSCASLDMYTNFEARGQAFVDALKECA